MKKIIRENSFVQELILCPSCSTTIPCNCGFEVGIEGNIIQLTDLPDMNIEDSSEDKYIGYEHIGEHYSGYDGDVIIDDYFQKVSTIIKGEVKDGIILDLGCGDGDYAVPFVMHGIKVIAGDISNKMMRILLDKLDRLQLDTSFITCIRMNAYNVPIINQSMDAVIANSMLHLNSNPTKIIKEIYRVLKPNVKFYCFDDTPGPRTDESSNEFVNHEYYVRMSNFHKRYFELLKDFNIYPRRYSWKFDRNKVCSEIFKSSYEIIVNNHKTVKRETLYEGFYKRMKGKGFSDQSAIPDEIHINIFNKVDQEMIANYGDNYKSVELTYYSKQITIKVFVK